jgi:hypothetical protein
MDRDRFLRTFRLADPDHGRFRDECLNENWFSDLADAREKITQWKQDYNEKRPHSSLQYRTPVEFAAQAAGFYKAGLGARGLKRRPLAPDPHPRYAAVAGRTKRGESLIILGLKMGGRSESMTQSGLRQFLISAT